MISWKDGSVGGNMRTERREIDGENNNQQEEVMSDGRIRRNDLKNEDGEIITHK